MCFMWKTLCATFIVGVRKGEMGMQHGLWQAVLGEIELSVSRGNFVTWFKNTTILKQDDEKIVIGVQNVFIKQQLERKYDHLVRETLQKNGVSVPVIEYKIHALAGKNQSDDTTSTKESQHTPTQPLPLQRTQQDANPNSSLTHAYRQGLNEKYTFDNFIVGSGNELAHAACQAIAANPGSRYNPLFLYGGVGIGKTHLIQAVGNTVLQKNPTARIVYVSTEQFVQEFVDALRYKKNTAFADYYRGSDVLIVDDVQFLAGKEKIQEEFFHTFNALHQANKQIIISSDKPPKEIPTLEERLRSRFVWGMSIDMKNPDLETRCAIVQAKAESHGANIDYDVAQYLANYIQTNIRELEGALNQLLAYCEMRNLPPNLATTMAVLGAQQTRPKHLSTKQIIERTAKYFQVSMDDIMSPKRDKDIVVPRQVAMYLLRSELHLSFPKIARELGRKDHTTAIHSVEKIEQEVRQETDISAAVHDIKERLYV